jgi:pimeloyl-ACP methyl ester carboxylesterase
VTEVTCFRAWRGRRLVVAVVAALSLVHGCSATGLEHPGASAQARIQPGLGEFLFAGYRPVADRPVRVYYSAPANPATAEIIVVMHGQGRNGKEYLADWEPLVTDRNVLVLVPEFPEELYPDEAYNVGNAIGADGQLQPREEWTFHVVEALFSSVVGELGSQAQNYALFGHSAGAQFVHRFIELVPQHRARVAVAANAGWYTVPDDSIPFPYGLEGAPVEEEDLGPAFASDLVVLLGGDDVDPDDDSLRRDERSDAQGRHRLERGLHFYLRSQQVAHRESLPFRWRLQVVPGLAHSHRDAAAAAAPLLLETR